MTRIKKGEQADYITHLNYRMLLPSGSDMVGQLSVV